MKYIFLDTNIFIHFQYFENVEWSEIVGDSDFTIVLAPIVIDELDKHKYSSNKKVAKKVKTILSKIEKIIENPTSCKLGFHYITQRPSDDLFSKYGLDKKEQDDSLLASIIEFSDTKQIDDIVYISHDIAPKLKAKSLGIFSTKLPEKYLLVEEQDELEKKIAQLQKENNEFKNQIPKVRISFFNDSELFTVQLSKPELSKETVIQQGLNKIKNKYPYISLDKGQDKNPFNNPRLLIQKPKYLELSEHQIKQYNDSLDEYYKEYLDFLESGYKKLNFFNTSIKICLKLSNTGTVPADDIDVNLHFPDGFELLSSNDIPKLTKEPQPPYKPKHGLDYNFSPLSHAIDMSSILPRPSFQNPKNVYPIIKKTNSYNVLYKFNSLKHHSEIELDTLYAKFDSASNIVGFTIDYKVIVGNVPNLINGQLNIKIEK